MNINKCLDTAVAQQYISPEEAADLKKRLGEIRKQVASDGEAKETLVKEIEAEAANRKRVAAIMEDTRVKLVSAIMGYRNLRGEADPAEAFMFLHEDMGRFGSYMKDAASLAKTIEGKALGKLEDLVFEFRRGALTGDLRRDQAAVRARMLDWVKELHGEDSGNAAAKALAAATLEVLEEMRLRYNEAGGMIGKLEGYGGPQSHRMEALLDGDGADNPREKWLKYITGDGVLDRDRMVHPLTGRKLTDAELLEAMDVAYSRITTDGLVDKEITGAPVGRGALWKRHADHRFIHFKNATEWMKYAERYGNPDPFAAIMGHISRMSRDIAHMETFGPNPNVMREYLKNFVRQQAAQRRGWGDVLTEQAGEARKIAAKLTQPVANADQIIEQITAISREVAGLRTRKSEQTLAKIEALHHQSAKLEEAFDVQKFTAPEDQDAASALSRLFEEMRDPLVFKKYGRNAATRADYLIDRADAMWELQRGSLAPVSMGLANVMTSVRNWFSASALQGAMLSAVTDVGFGQSARQRLGMGLARSNFGKVIAGTLQGVIPGMTRREAVRAGLSLDSAINMLHRRAKEERGVDGRFVTGLVADRIMTFQGLAPWTQSGKHLYGLEAMGFFADISHLPFDQLHKLTQRSLKDHGFDAVSWDVIRGAEKYEPADGATYLRPNEIEPHVYDRLKGVMDEDKARIEARNLSERYLAMIFREMRYAVPEATFRSRSITSGRMKPGTIPGEAWRSMGQFKGFGIAVAQLYTMRFARELMAGDASAMRQASAMLLTSAFLGAIAVALKDVREGRDPRKWLDEKTYLDWQMWGSALLQGGGFGIYGDFLFSNTGRFGQSIQNTLAGPVADRVNTALGATVGNATRAARGEKTTVGRDVAKMIRQNTPGPGLWYFGPLFQRTVFDSLERMMDPEAYKGFRRDVMNRQKNFRQEYYWPPGQSFPSRAPNMSRVISTR